MCHDRGYLVTQDELDQTLEQFKEQFGERPRFVVLVEMMLKKNNNFNVFKKMKMTLICVILAVHSNNQLVCINVVFFIQ